jgi:hypothetical protein
MFHANLREMLLYLLSHQRRSFSGVLPLQGWGHVSYNTEHTTARLLRIIHHAPHRVVDWHTHMRLTAHVWLAVWETTVVVLPPWSALQTVVKAVVLASC